MELHLEEKAALEAILFAMGEPVALSVLAQAVSLSEKETSALMGLLMAEYEKPSHGIQILALEDRFQMTTKKECYPQLIHIASHPAKPKLTEVTMETLSIIAYKQPVTKAEIEQIRGVSSDHAVNKLISYNLVQEVGRLDAPGKPILFGTTDQFLRYFGLNSKDNLPEISAVLLEDFRAEAEEEAETAKEPTDQSASS